MVDVKVIVLVIGISALAVALAVVLERLKSLKKQKIQVQDTILQNGRSGKTFFVGEEGIGKPYI